MYSSPNIRIIKSRRMKWTANVARTGAKRLAYRLYMGERQERRLLGRPKHGWVNNIKLKLVEI